MSTPKVCIHCNALIHANSVFCPACGKGQNTEEVKLTQGIYTNYGSSNPYESQSNPFDPPPPPKPGSMPSPVSGKKKGFFHRKVVIIPGIILIVLSLFIGGTFFGIWSESLYYAQHPPAIQESSNSVSNSNFDFADTLVSQNQNQWDENTSNANDYFCTFKDGSYHIVSLGTEYNTPCLTYTTKYKNLFMKVDMTVLKTSNGEFLGGIELRAENPDRDGYRFYIGSKGASIQYKAKLLSSTASATVKPNQKYTLEVSAYNNNLSFYIDGILILTLIDNNFTKEGFIGFDASESEVSFSNLKVVTL